MNSENNLSNQKKRILCIADGPNWIFNRHIMYLKQYLNPDFEINTSYRGQSYRESDFDLVYPLEFNLVHPDQINDSSKYVTGIRSFVSWADWDFLSLVDYLNKNFRSVHVVSKELEDIFEPYVVNLAYVSHGLDVHFFRAKKYPNQESGKLRLGWAGNRNTHVKGFWQYVEPLKSITGVDLIFCGYADRNLTLEEMPDFYDSIDAYICASSYEGSNNTLLEAASMERAIITTRVGTVSEYLKDHESALIVDRDLEKIQTAVIELRDHPELRLQLGRNARISLIEKGWDWSVKAKEFHRFFSHVLDHQITTNQKPKINQTHLARVVKEQNNLLRELRVGDGIRKYELEETIKQINQELEDIRHSETYRLAKFIQNSPITRLINRLFK